MSQLQIFHETNPQYLLQHSQDGATIAEELQKIGIVFQQWPTQAGLPQDHNGILVAYAEEITRLQTEHGYQAVDVVRLTPDLDPQKSYELRQKFLNEHTHDDHEVRFFVEGSGMFYLHLFEHVYMILCDRGDFISIPAHTPHWFDMSDRPQFTAIRLFMSPDGWVPHFTGTKLSEIFLKYQKDL